MTHRTLANANAAEGPARHGLDARSISGFSNFLGAPGPAQRSTLGADLPTARAILAKLSAALPIAPSAEAPTPSAHPVWKETLRSGVNVDDNPCIPSGYTYLLQFVAHDLVQLSLPFWAAADAGIGSRNMRSNGLLLDTLYGGGPIACPAAFEPAGATPSERSLLRLGRVHGATQQIGQGGCPFRDVARVNLMDGLDTPHDSRDSVNFSNAHHTYIADPRNDDTILLTQMTVLMSMAHNAIAKATRTMSSEAAFGHARNAMLMMYYKIISNDLLKKVLHPAIEQKLSKRDADDRHWLWDGRDVPLEFSHGAFRVGHAMVRGHYELNARGGKLDIVSIIDGNHSSGDAFHPLPPAWVLQWSRFFDLGETPNFARRIGPTKSRLDHEGLFRNAGPAAPDGISFRDALSSAVAPAWRVDALIEEIKDRRHQLIPHDWVFADADARRTAIQAWLRKVLGPSATREVNVLADDLPLPVFILLEAAQDQAVQGRSLGVLGSIIVGEVLFRRVAEGRRQLQPMLDETRRLLPDLLWESIERVDTMPELIRFVAEAATVGQCPEMPFI